MVPIAVSVIVPVYNTEKYLVKCLDSLLAQTLDSLEIIVVDDGSTDSSPEILARYIQQHPDNLSVITQQNQGLGAARNAGIAVAKGSYIGFVDSDDWVDRQMFRVMYDTALAGNSDIVICDCTSIYEGWEQGWRSTGYRGAAFPPSVSDFVMASTNPSTAWCRLYRRSLFSIIQFSETLYEDIATIPVLCSYANTITYLPLQLYYYLQRDASITRMKTARNLEVMRSWLRALENVKEDYLKEAAYAVYFSIATFITFKPEWCDEYLAFFQAHAKSYFEGNALIRQGIQELGLADLFTKQFIPKRIHLLWFGGGEKSELILRCIDSWKTYAPDYEIMVWSEENCDIAECPYVQQAYAAKKWAFVSDYFRVKRVYEHGGFYLDTDTELCAPIDILRTNAGVFGFETRNAVHAGLFGGIAGAPVLKEWLEHYQNASFLNEDGSLNQSENVVRRLTNILTTRYNLELTGRAQILPGDIKVYPANVLLADTFDGENLAIHHYLASWWDVTEGQISYKHTVLRQYFLERYAGDTVPVSEFVTVNSQFAEASSELVVKNNQLTAMESSLSWRLTKPIRWFLDKLRRLR